LRQAGWLTDEGYLDSTLVTAYASSDGLHPTTASAQSFAEQVKEVNGIFLGPSGPEPNASVQAYQEEKGQLPLPKSDPDARWAKGSRGPARLSYKVSVLSEDNGFITAHRTDRANVGDHAAGTALLAALDHPPASLAADKGYSAGSFRRHLRERGIRSHIPLPEGHPPRFLEEEGFSFNPFALLCPEGQSLKVTRKGNHRLQYRGQPKLCAPCPRLEGCRAARKYGFTLGEDSRELVAAVAANRSPAYKRALRRRRCVAEGNMASLKRLGLERIRHSGLNKVGTIVSLSVLAHNMLRVLRLGGRHLPAGSLVLFSLVLTLAILVLR
jgi:IS5 family transposase